MAQDKSDSEVIPARIPSRKAIPPFESLRAFDAVARLGGIRRAAQSLLRDHAVVSRHLRAVEDWTGCTLLERMPGGAVLTEQGHIYHEKISQAIDMIATATIDLMKRSKDNSLHVWSMPGFALHWLIKNIGEFEQAYPNMELELRSTREQPDFSRHEADIAVRLVPSVGQGSQLPPGVKCLEIARPSIIAVASPAYLERHTQITKPADLFEHHLLYERDFDGWRLWFSELDLTGDFELNGARLWDGNMTLAAAREGRGICLSNRLIVVDDIEDGQLVHIGAQSEHFPQVTLWSYQLMGRADRWDLPEVTVFREWLMEQIAAELS